MQPLDAELISALAAVRDLRLRNKGVAPTYEELAEAIAGTKWTARMRVRDLCRAGLLSQVPGCFRSIAVTRAGHRVLASTQHEKVAA